VSSPDVLAGAVGASDVEPAAVLPGWGRDECAGVWAMLLPAEVDGGAVLADLPVAATALLLRRYPGAAVLASDGLASAGLPGTVRWDGIHAPVRAGLGFVACTSGSSAALADHVADDGALAVVGGRPGPGDVALAPDEVEPKAVVLPGRGAGRGVRDRLRRVAADVMRRRIALTLRGIDRSLADAVLADVGAATGMDLELTGVLVGVHAVLRGSGPSGDVAVNVALPDSAHEGGAARLRAVDTEVESIRPWLPRRLASGETLGCRWHAYQWAGGQGGRRVWSARGAGWQLAREAAALLAETRTGTIGDGDVPWARRWSEPANTFGPRVRAAFEATLAALPADVPTSWCHGDLWSGNLLFDGDGVTLIDWDNARRDAPAGIDGVLVEAWRRQYAEGRTFGQACAELCAESAVPDLEVGGRPWAAWSDDARRAMVAAAFLLHVANRAPRDLDDEWRESNLTPFLGADVAVSSDEPATGSLESRAARGGLWLAVGTITSKGVQTLVLVVLARLLAPRQLGLLSIGALVVNVAGVVQELGASEVVIYRATRVRDTARTALTLMLGGSAVITVICWVFAPPMARFLNAPDGIGVIRGLTVVLPCYAAASMSLALLRRDLDFRRRIVPDVVPAVIGGVVSIVMAFLDYGVTALVVGQIVQGILTPITAWGVGERILPGWDRGLARAIVQYGRNVVGADVLQLALLNIDYTIVARVLGAKELGVYSLAFRLCYLPFVNVTYVVNGAAFAYYCRLPSREDLAPAVRRVMGALAIMVVPVFALMAALAPHIELLGEKWDGAVGPIRALAIYGLLLSFSQGGQTVLRAVGRPDLNFRTRALHVATLAAALLVVTREGVTAVSIAQAAVALVVVTVSWVLVRRQVPQLSFRSLASIIVSPSVGVVAMVVAVVAVRAAGFDDAQSFVDACVNGCAGLGAYAAVVWLLDAPRLREAARVIGGRS
jgi:O-antigen/teichoic acid export membrane protein